VYGYSNKINKEYVKIANLIELAGNQKNKISKFIYKIMFIFNYLFENLFSVYQLINSVLISFLNNYIFEGIIIISIIWLASGQRAARILDVGSKVIGSAAGSTFLYNYWVKGNSPSQPSNEDNDKNKKDKNDNKKVQTNQVTNGK
jgi:hypothetical protein